jgi:hypothetical protein
MPVTVLATDEYEPTEYDAALVRERTVLCLDADAETVRLVPLDNVVSVEGDAGDHLHGPELPGWFHGGGEYGLVDLDAFPALAEHVADLDREAV